ncbi:uncharacterized protein TRUGW13939_10640 [Talaromyces rugulosus]|uniref:Rhodopsin domain-containing protein n=1 Tax=Talaromyces rugulosus TaxID=121627 RepID=A0A7H8RAI9_TALRU|nr:uncharacterized protein TRUGW13939_10640 [Talaromyces rugulosus]QKX63470.1 hypothetical protein TRUGW13939_10640 [Talaromyces rugulosus]
MTYVNEASVLGVSMFFLILGTLTASARVFVQLKTSRLTAADWLSFLAWSLVMGECGIMIAGATTHTVGAHSTPNLGPEVLDYNARIPIRSDTDLRARDAQTVFLIGIVVVWAITFLICLLAQCGSNIATNFGTLGDLKAKCTDTFAILIGLAASDVAVDLVILSIPLPLVISLRLPLKKRIGIVAVLAIGMSATACGIARMSLFVEILGPSLISKPTVGGVSSDDDIGNDNLPCIVSILMFWGMLEMGIAVVAICLPVLYRLRRHQPLRDLMGRLRLYGLSNSSHYSGTEIFDLDDPRHTAWLQTQPGECVAQVSHVPKTSGDAE